MLNGKVSVRGWISAITIALILSAFIWFAGQKSVESGAGSGPSDRSYTIARQNERDLIAKIRSDSLPELNEPQFLPRDSAWLEYRSRPSSSLASHVEPSAKVVLMAPQAEQTLEQWQAESIARSNQRGNQFLQVKSDFVPVAASRLVGRSERPNLGNASRNVGSRQTMTTTWPTPRKLLDQLNTIESTVPSVKNYPVAIGSERTAFDFSDLDERNQSQRELKQWADAIKKELHNLDAASIDETVYQTLSRLEALAEQGLNRQDALTSPEMNEQVVRMAYSLKRRLKLWKGVYDCLSNIPSDGDVANLNKYSPVKLNELIARVRNESISTGDVAGWNSYLLLDPLSQLASRATFQNDDVLVVRRLLDRVSWRGVSEAQRLFLDNASVRELANFVQPLAIAPIDYRKLLNDFEVLEDEPLHRCSEQVTSALQSLRYSNDSYQIALGNVIDTYYRNANLRFAVSQDLLNRFVPADTQTVRAVRQKILGADTTGGSTIDTQLKLQLLPNPNAWHLKLNLDASVASRTASEKGPAVVHNTSQMNVNSDREILISADALQIKGSRATVNSTDRVQGVQTDFDSLPVLGDMVRYFVDREVREKRPLARRISENIVVTQTDNEFNKQLDENISQAKSQLNQRLIKPMQFLGIDSDVVDLQTTDTRLIARYRIATQGTLAAYTPRPQAPSDSLLSVQLHQSAINNACNQLGLGSRDWTLNELVDELSSRMSVQAEFDRKDLPENVILRFEQANPITLEFTDNNVWLTLRIAKLSEPGRIDLSNFVIRVNYECVADGIQADLVRTGAISVDGERLGMRDRLPLRAIFGRIFASHSKINLVGGKLTEDQRIEGLAVSQIITREGWLALAISPETSPHVALLQSNQKTIR